MTIPDSTAEETKQVEPQQSGSRGGAPEPSADGTSEGDLTFVEWLKAIPKTYDVLTAAVAAAVGLLAPERFLPQPLSDFRYIPSLVVLISFVLTWAWRQEIRRHFKLTATFTLLLALILFALNFRYVRPVDYEDPEPETISYLIGETVSNPGQCGTNYEIIIKQCGGDWAALSRAWGTSFYVVAASYTLTYVLFVVGLIMSIGGTSLARPSATHDRNREPHTSRDGGPPATDER